jgi:hypothetical protein
VNAAQVNANQVHSTVTWAADRGESYGWRCQDCPAKADGYPTEKAAHRIARIHEDPSRKTQGRTSAATKN